MRSWFPGVNHRGGISQPKTVQILYHHHMLSLKGRVTMDLARKCPRKMPVPLIDTQETFSNFYATHENENLLEFEQKKIVILF